MKDIHRFGTNSRMSMAVVHGSTVYVSGQLALGSRDADILTQTREILDRIDTLLADAGSHRDRLLSATIWLTDMDDFDAMNREWEAWLPVGAAPARATVGALLALEGFTVEIAVIAATA